MEVVKVKQQTTQREAEMMKTLYEWTMQVQEAEKKAAESTMCIQDIAVAQLASLHKEIMEMQMRSSKFL